MVSKTDCSAIFIALTLAATAAIMSMPGQANEVSHSLQLLLLTGAAPDAATSASAIGETSNFPVSP